jgi:hypothetical protein
MPIYLRKESVRDNPRRMYAKDKKGNLDWMYRPVDLPYKSQHITTMKDGERVQYKYHICLDFDDYLTRTREIVTNFLFENKIYHKSVSEKHGDFTNSISNEGSSQYGKTFTIYCSSLKDFYIVAKGMEQLVAKYKLKGIPLSKFKSLNVNMAYEIPVPGTNNTLYYTVEKASTGIIKKLADEVTAAGYEYKKYRPGGGFSLIGITQLELVDMKYDGMMYITSSGLTSEPDYFDAGYGYRQDVMDMYWGQGPIDFLF